MAYTRSVRSDYIGDVCRAATEALHLRDIVYSLEKERDEGVQAALIDATGDDPEAEGYVANDFAGHEGLVKANLADAFTALDAIIAPMNAGHGVTLQKIRTSGRDR
jgi:hypothetical protein